MITEESYEWSSNQDNDWWLAWWMMTKIMIDEED